MNAEATRVHGSDVRVRAPDVFSRGEGGWPAGDQAWSILLARRLPGPGERAASGRSWAGARLVQPARVDQPEHGDPLLVGGFEVHLDVEAPVVVARRIVENLPNVPHLGGAVDDQ